MPKYTMSCVILVSLDCFILLENVSFSPADIKKVCVSTISYACADLQSRFFASQEENLYKERSVSNIVPKQVSAHYHRKIVRLHLPVLT